ncbi:hypothetical protein J4231_00930 [Candidatus Woesearchaeota archaeon]|nr:hypothetical protein [Candidatus Woesearchaeota archaeon]
MEKRLIIMLFFVIFFLVGCANKGTELNEKYEELANKPVVDKNAEIVTINNEYVPSKDVIKAKIAIDASKNLGKINPLIYGNNAWIENSKLNIPSFPVGDKQLFYNEQIKKFYAYFNIANEMNPSIIRIPGGLQSNHDNWRKYAGDFSKRPETSASGIKQIVVAGLDEHVNAANNIGAEIVYTVNYALGPDIAAELVKYLQGKNVKYYEIGNELNCGMKKGNPLIKNVAEDYAKNLVKFSDAMKAVDPGIKIGAIDDCNKLGKEWYDTVSLIAGNKFDFWSKHAYSPGADGNVRGVTINNAGVSLRTKHYFRDGGNYEFEMLAEGKKQFDKVPGFDVLIDSKKIGIIKIDEFSGLFKNEPEPKFYKINSHIQKGMHDFEIVSHESVENNVFLALHPVIRAVNNGNEEPIDLRDDEKIANMVMAGALSVGKKLEEEKEFLHEKPVFVTEWNTIYSFDECSSKGILKDRKIMCSRNNQLREALNMAEYYNVFINEKDIVNGANFWLLFTEIGNMDVSDGKIKINPSFYVSRLYSNNIRGEQIETAVESPSYKVGYDTGITMGIVSKSMNVPYVSAISTMDENGLSIGMINKDIDEDAKVIINLKNIDISSNAVLYTLYSENLYDNELKISYMPIAIGPSFEIVLPRHSINVMRIPIAVDD